MSPENNLGNGQNVKATLPQKLEYKGRTIVGKMLERIAPRVGATILFDPYGYTGQITFRNGKRAYFRGTSIGLNAIAPSDIAKDKDHAKYFMNAMKYRVIPGQKFYSEKRANDIKEPEDSEHRSGKMLDYVRSVGFPLIVKPNSGSQGRGVARVDNEAEFLRAVEAVFEMDKIVLVEQLVIGKDYRLVVLGDKIISAYERIPLNVNGDGISNISKLLELKQKQFETDGRDTKIKFDDSRIVETLALQSLTLDSVPDAGVNIKLLSNANLSSGGDAVDVTDQVSDDLRELCVSLTKDMGLKLCGVDLMLPNGIQGGATGYYVLEINAAPGLDHYVTIGAAQDKIVEDLYLEILKNLEEDK